VGNYHGEHEFLSAHSEPQNSVANTQDITCVFMLFFIGDIVRKIVLVTIPYAEHVTSFFFLVRKISILDPLQNN
jgi:hypothetical protein